MTVQMEPRCPSCGGDREEIVLLDNASEKDVLLEYAAVGAKRSRWTMRYPRRGRVAAAMCQSCGLIALYGLDYPSKEAAEEARGRLSLPEPGPSGGLSEPEPKPSDDEG
jgi:hypothetical protein